MNSDSISSLGEIHSKQIKTNFIQTLRYGENIYYSEYKVNFSDDIDKVEVLVTLIDKKNKTEKVTYKSLKDSYNNGFPHTTGSFTLPPYIVEKILTQITADKIKKILDFYNFIGGDFPNINECYINLDRYIKKLEVLKDGKS